VGRNGGEIQSSLDLVKSSHPNVRFELIDRFSSLKRVLSANKVKGRIQSLANEVDAIVARLPSENGLVAATLAQKIGKPCALEIVGCAWDALWNYGGIISKIYAPFAYKRMQGIVSKSDHNLYVTNCFLQKRYKGCDKAYNISASNVHIAKFCDDILNKRIDKIKSFNRLNDILQIGIIGNFKTKYKGIHLVIKALGFLKQRYGFQKFHFRILGKGDSEKYEKIILKYDLSDNVFFEGTLPNGQAVFEWLDKIDVYVQPSLQEGLPRSVIEAMSRASIVIGSNTGGIPELLDDRFIVSRGSFKELKMKIKEVINLSTDELIPVAQRNFFEAKKYEYGEIDKCRYEFYQHLVAKAKKM
jgi:glycosyltransferase involved in cell wall biosynthesis